MNIIAISKINSDKKIKMGNKEYQINNKDDMQKKIENEKVENSFWSKVKLVSKKGGDKVIAMTLVLFYSLPKLSITDKKIAIGALYYFISPFKLIPDIIPVIGYLDYIAILTFAWKTIIDNMKKEGKADVELKIKVKNQLHSFIGKYDEKIVGELFD